MRAQYAGPSSSTDTNKPRSDPGKLTGSRELLQGDFRRASSPTPRKGSNAPPVDLNKETAGKRDDPIAIVGMACRVPKARSVEQYWDNLVNGIDAISKVPEDRWNADLFVENHLIPTTQGGFVSDIDKFDAGFFHVPPHEAEVMDPQQRQILEVTHECLESGGITMEKIKSSHTGVFAGVYSSDYKNLQYADSQEIRPYVASGGEYSVVANRISFFYDLKGPSLSIDTACSSSLVALHFACNSIKSGEISSAIVVGVNALLAPEQFISLSKMNMLSPDGRSKAFDASANGFVRSEGFLALYLKPLSKALADHDPVRAVIHATAVNQDGSKSGFTFPRQAMQEELLHEVYSKGTIRPKDIQYVEMHGTGTPAGDPIESRAVGKILGAAHENDSLLIGSVKSNIGHLESASGLAGLIKLVLSMEHGMIPGNLHFQKPNPNIDFEGLNLSVVSKLTTWPKSKKKCAGVNSFGFGGSNAHVILEEYSAPAANIVAHNAEYFPFIFSSHTKQGTEQLLSAFKEYLDKSDFNTESLKNVAYTLACRRSMFPFRTSFVSNSKTDVVAQLVTSKVMKVENQDIKVLFVFTGQGAQYFAMGRELLRENSIFLLSMQRCEAIIKEHMGWSLLEELSKSESESIINRPDISQPACAALHISLVNVWESYGVKPSVIVGHSSGEIGACYAAGILSLEDTMLVAIARAIALRDVPSAISGKMAAVSITESQAQQQLVDPKYIGCVSVAAVNSPSNVTLSGDASKIDELVAEYQRQGIFAQILRTERAYHSLHMVDVGKKQTATLRYQNSPTKSKIPMVSTVTGHLLDGSQVNAEYWERNLTGTVKFVSALQYAAKEIGFHAVVEVGPHPALAGPIRQSIAPILSPVPPILGTICRKEAETRRMLLTACALADIGFPVSFACAFNNSEVVTNLPSYPWQGKNYWHEAVSSKAKKFPSQTHELLGSPALFANEGGWLNTLRLNVVEYLQDHRIQGSIVFPGAGYIAMMVAASGATERVVIEDINFTSALMLSTETATKMKLVFNSSAISVHSESGPNNWQKHCNGKLSSTFKQPTTKDFNSSRDRCTQHIAKDELYNFFRRIGTEYGPNFQGITEAWKGDLEAYAYISAPASALQTRNYLLHPTILDAAFQTMVCTVLDQSARLPTKLTRLSILRPCIFAQYVVYAKCTQVTSQAATGDIYVFSVDGLLCCTVEGLVCTSISGGKQAVIDENNWLNNTFEIEWKEDLHYCPLLEAIGSSPIDWDETPNIIATASLYAVYKALKVTDITPAQEKQFAWIEMFVKSSLAPEKFPQLDVHSTNIEIQLISKVSKELENILIGKTDPKTVISEDINILFANGPASVISATATHDILLYLSHKNCNLNILQIGGTSNAVDRALNILKNKFASFTFADISSSQLEKISTKLHGAKVNFSLLNIENDPLSQGFQENQYDCIIASDVLCRTTDVVASLRNCLKLLKPRGKIIMTEIVNCPVFMQAIFGLLEDWWAYNNDPRRSAGPTINEEGWRRALGEAGISTYDVIYDGVSQPIHASFVFSKEAPSSPIALRYLIPDEHGFATKLASILPGSVIARSASEIPKESNVIYLPSLSPILFDGITASMFADIKLLASNNCSTIFITSGALMDATSPEKSTIVGLLRTLRNEYQGFVAPLIDIESIEEEGTVLPKTMELICSLLSDVSALATENEISIRNSKIYIPRLKPTATVPTKPKKVPQSVGNSHVKAQIETRGLLNTLHWVSCPKLPELLSERQVAVHSSAFGVNFKDVMIAMGLVTSDAMEASYNKANFGFEYAGVVERVGANSQFKVGDRVCAFGAHNFDTYPIIDSDLVVKIPDSMTFYEAATIPMCFLTAMYGFDLARLEKGDTVLIHAGAGGIGQAAIQLCLLAGAEVFVTVGSEKKRKFIQEQFGIPEDHIMNSRTLEFAEQMKEKTGGRGADIVLNALAGDFLQKGMEALSEFGRFVEIGIRDIYSNNKLDMLPFARNKSFTAVDLGHVILRKPQHISKMLHEVIALFAQGKMKPLVLKTYPLSKIEDAFRSLQQGENIGKIVLSVTEDDILEVVPPKTFSASSQGIYVLVGGMGGFGRAVATWLASKGAAYIAFISRSGDSTPAAQQLLKELSTSFPSLKVAVGMADVSNLAQLTAAIAHTKSKLNKSRILGVMQMAMVIEDIQFENSSPELFNKVLLPKTIGTQNLEKIVAHETDLEFFVMFSSIAGILGTFGQASYAAANSYMDALAVQRKAKGLTGTSINWGLIGDVGYAHERKGVTESLTRRGFTPLSIDQALEALEYAIVNQLGQVAIAPFDMSKLIKTQPALASAFYSHLHVHDSMKGLDFPNSEFTIQFSAADTTARTELVLGIIREKLGKLLGLEASDLEPSRKISELGVDSLMAAEFKNWVEKEFSVQISVLDASGKTINDISAKICTILADTSKSSTLSSEVEDILAMIKSDVDSVTKELDFSQCATVAIKAPKSILVTGATGFFGCQLLSLLLQKTTANIHVIVRAKDEIEAANRIKNNMKDQLCWRDADSARIIAHVGDLALPDLGLDKNNAKAKELLASVDDVFHAGAVVNWIQPYTQLKPSHVNGTTEILKLIAATRRKIPFHYISTFSATNLEFSLESRNYTVISKFGGYIFAKYAGEEISKHARSLGLPVAIHRLPLLAPHSTTGASNKEDIIYRTISSCLKIKAVPNLAAYSHAQSVAVPVDTAINSMLELASGDDIFKKNILHYHASEGASWFHIMEMLHKIVGLEKLPLSQWSTKIINNHCTVVPLLDVLELEMTADVYMTLDQVQSVVGANNITEMSWNITADHIKKIIAYAKGVSK